MKNDIFRPHKRRSSFSRPALIVIICIIIIFVMTVIINANKKFNTARNIDDKSEVYFEVENGNSISSIARNLEKQGLISKKFYFKLYISLKNSEDGIRADLYKLSPSQSIKEIASTLLAGESTRDNEITIIEGWTIDQVATEFAEFKKDFGKSDQSKDELRNEFIQAAEKASDYDYEFLKNIPKKATLEGYLFPDTYKLSQNSEPKDLIEKMLVNFDKKIDNNLKESVKQRDEDLFEIITLASIVQKEVQTIEDMRSVAGVYYNRLYIGRNLESDVTVNYVTGKNDPTPSYNDTYTDSLYNTYQNEGLPPGPVANPGLMAIEATINPTEHDYYYFLTRLDTGEALFSTRGYEHEAKKEKYLK